MAKTKPLCKVHTIYAPTVLDLMSDGSNEVGDLDYNTIKETIFEEQLPGFSVKAVIAQTSNSRAISVLKSKCWLKIEVLTAAFFFITIIEKSFLLGCKNI